jgi:hypothetical protein
MVANWRKASYSGDGDGDGSCVEVATAMLK